MADEVKEAKAAPLERSAKAGSFFADHLKYIRDEHGCYVKSKYLTINITNGKESTLTELRQRFPRSTIFRIINLPYPILGNHLSIYRVDPNKLTIDNYQRRLMK